MNYIFILIAASNEERSYSITVFLVISRPQLIFLMMFEIQD